MSLFSFNSGNAQNKNKDDSTRSMVVAGSFYPANKDSIKKLLADYFRPYKNSTEKENIAAIIVPHAGYVFSGTVAASAYAQIDANHTYEHIFLIGPSHHIYMDGASINDAFDYYETPLGKIKVDRLFCRKLIDESSVFSYNPSAHNQEHCLEVQLPFLQYHLKHPAPIVPIIIATQSFPIIEKISQILEPYFNKKNLFVISSDFSHYPSYKDAEIIDTCTGDAIQSGSLDEFIKIIFHNKKENIPNLVTSACGQSAIATLLYITAKKNDIKIYHQSYRNSGDSEYGEKDQVVGYHAFTFAWEKKSKEDISFDLTDKDKTILLKIARRSIESKWNKNNTPIYEKKELTDILRMKCGAFVTLNIDEHLRGCIGHFGNEIPLYQTVEKMAKAAAFEDPRFYPVQLSELQKIRIEISILSPLKKINNIDEFTLGKNGLYLSKGGRDGTFLPQVTEETHWTKEEFLGHCAQDKAGLEWNDWKDADLYTYETIVFKEK